jgi:23S rRNA (cytosine1962-C5)-methyltransferase
MSPQIDLLISSNWTDYELVDSGNGQKLERFGRYTFIRPEVQALWSQALPAEAWQKAHAVFQPTGEESGGHWKFNGPIEEKWEMNYCFSPTPPAIRYVSAGVQGSELEISSPVTAGTPAKEAGPQKSFKYHTAEIKNGHNQSQLRFWAQTTPGRHLGVFPEGAANWDWMAGLIRDQAGNRLTPPSSGRSQPARVLNLFGYTGLATLAAAAAGAQVTHVDASKKSVTWARENQALSGLSDLPIRWIVDDALKFVQREARRGVKYDGILLDPPKFGRGPRGEVWEVYKSLPELLHTCRAVLSEAPLFVILTVYAVKLPAIHAYMALGEMLKGLSGRLECGELVTLEKSANRLLSQAVYARWSA